MLPPGILRGGRVGLDRLPQGGVDLVLAVGQLGGRERLHVGLRLPGEDGRVGHVEAVLVEGPLGLFQIGQLPLPALLRLEDALVLGRFLLAPVELHLLVGLALGLLLGQFHGPLPRDRRQLVGLVLVALADLEQRGPGQGAGGIVLGHGHVGLAGLGRLAQGQVRIADLVQGRGRHVALRPVRHHLAILDDALDRVGQLRPHDRGDLELGVEGLPLALLVDQLLEAGEVLEDVDAAVGLGQLGVLREGRHVVAVGGHRLPPLAEIDLALGDRPLGLLHPLAVLVLVDHAAVGLDGVLPGLVGLVDLADHGQGLAGLGVPREAVDEGLQHVQGLDPAFLVLQRRADLEDGLLRGRVAAAADEVQLQVGLGRLQGPLQVAAVGLRRSCRWPAGPADSSDRRWPARSRPAPIRPRSPGSPSPGRCPTASARSGRSADGRDT